jgi:methyl-accepting chemotaxis protein
MYHGFSAWVCKISIRRRLILFFLLLSIIPVVLLGSIAYQYAKNTITNKITEYSLQSLVQASIPIDLTIQKYEDLSVQLLIDLEYQTLLKDYFQDGTPKSAPSQMFEDSLAYDPNVRGLLVGSVQNTNIYVGAGFGDLDGSYSRLKETPVYQEALEVSGQVRWGLVDNDLVMARVINNLGTGAPLGVFAVIFNGLKLNQMINFGSLTLSDSMSFGNSPYSILVKAEGEILSSPFTEEMGLTIYDLIEGVAISELIENKSNRGFFSDRLRDNDTLVTYYKMASKDWYLLGLAPYDYLYQEIRAIGSLILGFVMILILVAVFFSYMVSVGISNPLNQVKEAMAQAQKGDLSINVEINTRDELHDLGNSFNRMTAQIGELLSQTKAAITTVSNHSKVLESSSIQSTQSAEAIALASSEITKGTIEQTAEAEKTAKQMSALADQIDVAAAKFKEVEEITASTRQLSARSKTVMEELIHKTDETDEITSTITLDINELNKQSEEIKSVTQLIATIAEQTNLLALNAAIEAARADELGSGFAVVAEEVNKLSRRTDTAAKAIEDLLKGIQRKAANSSENVEKAHEIVVGQLKVVAETQATFDEIIQAMDLIVSRINELNAYIQQINVVKNQTTESTHNIVAISEQSAASSEEVTASIEEQTAIAEQVREMANALNAMGEKMVEVMSKFKV